MNFQSLLKRIVHQEEAVKNFTEAAEKGDIKTLKKLCTGKMSTVVKNNIKAKQIKQYSGYELVYTIEGKWNYKGKAIVNCKKKQSNGGSHLKISLLLVNKNNEWLIENQKQTHNYLRFEEYYKSHNNMLFKQLCIAMRFYALEHNGDYPQKTR